MQLRGYLSLVAVLMIAAPAWAEEATDEISFNRDIRPILSNNCFTCHGPDEGSRATELRFDDEKIVLGPLKSGATAIVANDLQKSDAFRRVAVAMDHDDHMPPADSPKQLNPKQIDLLKRWIEQGAKWEKHWSQVQPVRGEVPAAVNEWKPAGEIDRFLHARIKDDQSKPSPEADRRTLIRRLYFDLIGLPPTPEEVAAFEQDKSPDAYEKIVDRLLASKQYGERMATWWLDLVRYSDSIGYHSDTPRDVWMYRDWVIASFNDNKPFDQFTIEQLAGDMLPEATSANKTASGYNRLLLTTEEGGAQAKEYLAKYDSDRVRNVSEVWLGATLGCAECHDHKYDPYTQADFYRFAAFFADINEPGVGKRAPTKIISPEQTEKLRKFDELIGAANAELHKANVAWDKDRPAWEEKLRKNHLSTDRHDLPWIDGNQSPAGGSREGSWNYVSKDQGPVSGGGFSRKQTSQGLVQHFVIGASQTIVLAEQEMLYAYVYLDPSDPPQQIMLQFNDGSWDHRAWWGEDKIPYGGVGVDAPLHRKMGPLPAAGQWVRLEVSPEKVGLKAGSVLNGFAFTQWGGAAYWGTAGVNRSGLGLAPQVLEALNVEPSKRTPAQFTVLAVLHRKESPELIAMQEKIADLTRQKNELAASVPSTLVTTVMAPRTIRILARGNWQDESGAEVQPNTPMFMKPLSFTGPRATRLDLAKWILDPENPMTARAQVNRLWKMYFGYGISRTLNDLGGQGQWPTHPKLLDWLSIEFIESGWNVKHMVRLMVTSTSYRQASRGAPEAVERDPYNRFFARQSRFRLDAETIRDNALDVSGMLVETIGGPSVKPYQPGGYWQHLNFPAREWQNDKGDSLYRRGLYTWWQRTFMYPSFQAFDATSREECTAERPRSNTPQQALVLLNDPAYIEAARVLGEKLTRREGDEKAKLQYAFALVLQRTPTAEETEVLLQLHAKHLAEYRANESDAKTLTSIGAKPAATDIDRAQQAAWTSVSRVLLNLHETITRY